MSDRSPNAWNPDSPEVLVLACSDGRFQEHVDDFLRHQLGISRYDRLYAPGGGGALSPSGFTYPRADFYRQECRFLIRVHRVKRVIAIFHGPAEGGPSDAVCGDYQRRFISMSAAEIRRQQQRDAATIRTIEWGQSIRLEIYACEITAQGGVQFSPM